MSGTDCHDRGDRGEALRVTGGPQRLAAEPVYNHTEELRRANEQLRQEIEERSRTEAELKRTTKWLENVIDNSVDAIGIVDRHGRFLLWNRRAVEIYGYTAEELAGKTAFELYADHEALDRMLAQLRNRGVVREYEILMRKKDGSVVPMDISLSLLKDDQGHTIGSVCVARDLSEHKKAGAELKAAQEELRQYSKDLERQVRERTREITSILTYTPSVVYITDREGRFRLVNARFEELFGVRQEEARGKTVFDLFPREVAEPRRASDLAALRERRPYQVEEPFPQDGQVSWYLTVKFPLYDESGEATGLCAISTDITALKKAQDQLRRLSGSIMASQEKERAALARELHDELGQVLTALRMDAVWLFERVKNQDIRVAERALTMCDLIDSTIDEVRGLATRLRPGVLDDFGLIDALDWYTREFAKRTRLACLFEHSEVPVLENTVATAAYRIAQEALTNVARHARATQVRITIGLTDGRLTLRVRDNGRGFQLTELVEVECLGLAGMRERAALVGGILQIFSQPGYGTQVEFSLPWDQMSA